MKALEDQDGKHVFNISFHIEWLRLLSHILSTNIITRFCLTFKDREKRYTEF